MIDADNLARKGFKIGSITPCWNTLECALIPRLRDWNPSTYPVAYAFPGIGQIKRFCLVPV